MPDNSVPSPIQPDLTKQRDSECIPLAKEVLKILAAHDDLRIGSDIKQGSEEDIAFYSKIYAEELAPRLLASDIKLDHVLYVFQLVRQAVDLLQERTQMTISLRSNQADAKLWGVNDVSDVRLSDVQRVLTEGVDKLA
jgi:hypothetical protein